MDAMSATMDLAPSEKLARDNMHKAKPDATTKKPATRHSVQDEARAGITQIEGP